MKGKVVENMEIDDAVKAITIVLQDRTVLSFDLEARLFVFSELSDCKNGHWRATKKIPLDS